MNSSKNIQIMAIINTSPDSFAGDGLEAGDQPTVEAALRKALDEGADILDIGGQSTRPGADTISADEEIRRVVPVIKLARELTDKLISVDTFKPPVAQAALEAGATIVNDVHGAEDTEMVRVVKEADCKVVIMHSRGDPKTMSQMTDYPKGVVVEVCDYLRQRAQALIDQGITKENIIVDPGIGFAKTTAQSFQLTHELEKIVILGYPVLYGASKKSFLGKVLGSEEQSVPVEKRIEATIAVNTYAMLHGATIIRVHDVKAAVATRTIVEALA